MRIRLAILLLTVCCIGASLPRVAACAVLHIKPGGSGAQTGASWGDAFANPQDALAVASSSDEIWVAAGTYTPTDTGDRTVSFALVDDVAVYGGFAGTETLRTERNWVTNVTILSGDLAGDDDLAKALDDPLRNNGENSCHVVIGASNATLDGFTVTGGNANVFSPSDYCGGGMHNDTVSGLTVANCTFSGNSASSYGGGMSNDTVSDLTVMDCTFSGNSASWGGGIYNRSSSATITDCTFSGNSATGDGGGMYNRVSPSLTVTNCTFLGNSATGDGGGMYNGHASSTITNCTFSGNSADGGGGMYNEDFSPIVTDCTFSGNSALEGGGMRNRYSYPIVTSCTFSGNSADEGGAIYNWRFIRKFCDLRHQGGRKQMS